MIRKTTFALALLLASASAFSPSYSKESLAEKDAVVNRGKVHWAEVTTGSRCPGTDGKCITNTPTF